MNAHHENGFGIGKLDGLTWSTIEGYAAEASREDGAVTYRGQYICTVFNDEWGGDIIDADGKSMTESQVQAAIDEIDARAVNSHADLLDACRGLLEHLPDDDWSDDPADPTCPLCGRPNPYAADDGAVEGPRAYHAECWYRVDAARDAIAKATGEE
jgi:hypothetical protein